MKTMYMDESGYTGVDLLNKEQPFQGALSLKIEEKIAQKLVNEYFPKRQSKELKHKILSKKKANWEKLLAIQKILIDEFDGYTYVCNKKFLLILLFLDTCVEPFWYKRGVNFYENGQNYALASLLYYLAPTFWRKEEFESLLYYFQRASKTKLDLNIQILIEKAKAFQGKELSEHIYPLIIEDKDCINELKSPNFNTDVSFVVLLSLISYFEKHIEEDYQIIHDTSKNLLSYNKIIKQFIDIEDNQFFKITH